MRALLTEESDPKKDHAAMSVSGEGNRIRLSDVADYEGSERRTKPRISKPFPARVRGIDESGHQFEMGVNLANLSVGGLYLRSSRVVPKGTRLFFLIGLAHASGEWLSGVKVAARGVVVREEPLLDGDCGIAVAFTRYRIL